MPHLFVPLRKRKYNLGLTYTKKNAILAYFSSDKFWEDFNVWVYLIGGIMFVIGSVFFLPQLSDKEAVGCWIFVVASAFWLIVAMHDAAELAHCHHRLLPPPDVDGLAAYNYIIGSSLFVLGSIFFLPSVALFHPGAWCFITGSFLFVAGAILNGLQIFEANTKEDMQYMLMTAMFYVVGSAMFMVASVPYLFRYDSDIDEEKIDTFLAGIFVAGSLCFTVGGIITFYRSNLGRKLRDDVLQETLLDHTTTL